MIIVLAFESIGSGDLAKEVRKVHQVANAFEVYFEGWVV
jgi:hypothetical protein